MDSERCAISGFARFKSFPQVDIKFCEIRIKKIRIEQINKKMNKKIIILIIVILLLMAGGVFWWWEGIRESQYNTYENMSEGMSWSSPEDYVIKDTSEGKIIENEKAGLKFEVPKGWEIKKESHEGSHWIDLLSSDAKFDKDNLLKEGCGVSLVVIYQENDMVVDERSPKYIRYKIELIKENPEEAEGLYENYEAVEIDGYPSLKSIGQDHPVIGQTIWLAIPVTDKETIAIETTLLSGYKERCAKEFDEFLKTVSID